MNARKISLKAVGYDIQLDEIYGSTYCRISYDALICYPDFTSTFPTNVFTKLYNIPDPTFENFLEKDDY